MWPASTARPAAPAIPEANRWLALGAVAGPALFTLAWFVLGFLSPGYTLFGARIAPYSPVSQPISGLRRPVLALLTQRPTHRAQVRRLLVDLLRSL